MLIISIQPARRSGYNASEALKTVTAGSNVETLPLVVILLRKIMCRYTAGKNRVAFEHLLCMITHME